MSARIDTAAERARLDALAGHTPGPWEWWTSNSWRRLKHDSPGLRCNVMEPFVASDGHPDCSVSSEDMGLIAAAPDLLTSYRAALAEIDRLTAALAEAEKIDQEDLHFVMSHPEAVAREMTKLRRQITEAEDRVAAQMRERAAEEAISSAHGGHYVACAIRALPLREPGAT